MLATVVTATLPSNSCKSTTVFDTFCFRSAETVRRERDISRSR